MAVTAVVTRIHATFDATTFIEFCTTALTGTYVTGGFTFNPFNIFAGRGSAPLPSSSILATDWYSPSGYNYRSTVAANVMTVKIFSASGTELANATAVPDASVPVTFCKRKL
jgi:hypothetical protein